MLVVSGGDGLQGSDGAVDTHCWVTVSAVAWHARPQQLRHDLISIRKSQDQLARHLVH